MIKKARKIEAIYEESLFCDECDVELTVERSNIALANGTNAMPMLVCPKCGKRECLTPEMLPQNITKTSEWIPIDDIPELKAVESKYIEDLNNAKEQIQEVIS